MTAMQQFQNPVQNIVLCFAKLTQCCNHCLDSDTAAFVDQAAEQSTRSWRLFDIIMRRDSLKHKQIWKFCRTALLVDAL